MSPAESLLNDLLTAKGYTVKDIWFYPTFGIQPGGWTATLVEKDEFGDEIERDYDLGPILSTAKANIAAGKITLLV